MGIWGGGKNHGELWEVLEILSSPIPLFYWTQARAGDLPKATNLVKGGGSG